MRSNSYNKYFGLTAFGESHGHSMGVVIEDIVPNIDFPFDALNTALARRKPGQSDFASSRQEDDSYEVISGLFEGKTTGMPICILFKNKDQNSADYNEIKDIFRPGHADFSWFNKFKIYDYRGGGRASGRETISRVAAGIIVKNVLGDIEIQAYPVQIGNIVAKSIDFHHSKQNSLYWPDSSNLDDVLQLLQKTKEDKESVGATVEIVIKKIQVGLGDPVFEKLDANLAKAIISIGGVKGIYFDPLCLCEGRSNPPENKMFGGIVGGVSDGHDVKIHVYLKPVSSIGKPQKALTKQGEIVDITIKGRHDVCLVPRILPVIESMIQLVLADAIAYQKLISGTDLNLNDYREAIDKIDEDIMIALYRRFEIVDRVAKFKKENQLSIQDKDRETALINNLKDIASEWNLSVEMIERIWKTIIEESRNRQV